MLKFFDKMACLNMVMLQQLNCILLEPKRGDGLEQSTEEISNMALLLNDEKAGNFSNVLIDTTS